MSERFLLAPQHPQRLALAHEVHARPSEALATPSRATHVAVLIDSFGFTVRVARGSSHLPAEHVIEPSVSATSMNAKAFVSEASVKVHLDAVQVHGGYGYMTEFEIERALRDAIGGKLYSGTTEIQRRIIARGLGL